MSKMCVLTYSRAIFYTYNLIFLSNSNFYIVFGWNLT